ncbi:glycosyl hydrolase [Fulvitalea axinellae]|uniref:beta-glucosidase n=1 Tax=Fulvitalea axinellae TaxID=1182444 RepID=A0AAU9C812_9BACT|nr:glycosyl hydrolase [Fulvitalea axinellae]
MRRLLLGIAVFFITLNGLWAQNAKVDRKIRDLLGKMTLEEKIGQMTQVNYSEIGEKGWAGGMPARDKLRKALLEYHVGSILNTPGEGADAVMWREVIRKIQEMAVTETRLKIPVIYGVDAIHGVSYTANSTLFPHNIGTAAGRDPELAKKIAQVTAAETRASGIRWNFDPVLGLGRQPLWPRFEETFGEDVLLVTEMGRATIVGYEGDGLKNPTAVASCMKHYIGYSVPRNGKDRTGAYISDIDLRERFLPPFKAAVDAGATTLMVNSAAINDIPVHADKKLLTDLLRDELGFGGLVVTDWEDIIYLKDKHRMAKDNVHAIALAINAGVDMSMVPMRYVEFCEDLKKAVDMGLVSEARIDEAVTRVLRTKFKLGLFDNPYPEKGVEDNFGKPEYAELALEAARESVTLLKNDTLLGNPVLPLAKDMKILVAGPASNSLAALHGSWSYTHWGAKENLYSKATLTLKEAIEKKVGKENVLCQAVTDFHAQANTDPATALKGIEGVDAVILCLGEGGYAEKGGDINELDLPAEQISLAKVAALYGKPVVLVLAEGRPRIVREIEPAMAAVLDAYRPGSKGADAVADILFGDHNPSGILPFSYPKYSGNITTYDGKFDTVSPRYGGKPRDVQWDFGHGLSYGKFELSELKLNSNSIRGGQKLTVSVKVTNTGQMDGKKTVELYTRDLWASVAPDWKRLRKFKKIVLKAGESQTVSFVIDRNDLSFVNRDLKRVTEDGDFEVMVGGMTEKFTYQNSGKRL